jgi:hypothetical protein
MRTHFEYNITSNGKAATDYYQAKCLGYNSNDGLFTCNLVKVLLRDIQLPHGGIRGLPLPKD